MLYVPGCNTRYLNKARSLIVDSVILDLGNPILIEAKEEARKNVVAAVKEGGFGSREVVVRVNDIDSPWGKDDIYAVANIGADAILFPNIESVSVKLRVNIGCHVNIGGGADISVARCMGVGTLE